VIAAPYFSVHPYLKQSASLEKRARERTTIQKFLAYLASHQITKEYHYLENRDDYLPQIAAQFPAADLLNQINGEHQLEARAIAFKAKFNGDRLMQLLPGLSGKALGEFIVKIKGQSPDFEEYVLMTEQAVIDQQIIDLYQQIGEYFDYNSNKFN
jgi:hypothetical protein